jgi:serine/threonine-protein kinase RsbT
VEITPLDAGPSPGLRLAFVDAGPGIRDLDQAMTDGYTSGGGLGLGMSGAKRLVQEFEVDSRPGEGTRVTVTSWATVVPPTRPGP